MLHLIFMHFKKRTVLSEPLSVNVLIKFSSLLSNPSYVNFANFIFTSLTLRAPRVLVPTPSTKEGGGGRKGPIPVSEEREMLQT